MKQYRYFNTKLYYDVLRQLKLIGFIFAGICIVLSVLPALLSLIVGIGATEVNTMAITTATPLLTVFIFAGGMGLVFSAFSFMTNRSASDYFHSLPNTATSTFFSVFAAAATWIVGTIIATLGTTYLAYLLVGLPLNAAFLPYLFGYYTIGTLLVAAAAALGVSVTGTKFSNFVLTMLILFLPRFLMVLSGVLIMDRYPIIPMDAMPFWINPLYNIAALPFSLFLSMIGTSSANPFTFSGAYIYSAILFAVYLTAAWFLFRRRRSETAGMSAPNRWMQHIIRCAITAPMLAVIGMFFYTDRNAFSQFDDYLPVILILFLVALIVYFVYELITTKKFKNLLTTLPLFLILAVAVPAGMYGTTTGFGLMLVNRTVDAGDIKEVYLDANAFESSGAPDYYGYDHVPSYLELGVQECAFRSAEMNRILSSALYRTVDFVKNTADDSGTSYQPFDYVVKARFKKGLTSFTRYVYLSTEEYEQVKDILTADEQYIRIKRMLPSASEAKAAITSLLVQNNMIELWDLYRSEMAAYGGAAYDDALYAAPYLNTSQHEDSFWLEVVGFRGVEFFRSYYPISEKTPKTLARYIELVNKENTENYKTFLSFWETLLASIKASENLPHAYDDLNLRLALFDPAKPQDTLYADIAAHISGQEIFREYNITKHNEEYITEYNKDFPDVPYIARFAERTAADAAYENGKLVLYVQFYFGYVEDASYYRYANYTGTLVLPVTEEEAELLRMNWPEEFAYSENEFVYD